MRFRQVRTASPAAWILIAAAAYGFQAATPPPANGTLEGQVVNGTTGAPLKRASVRLTGEMAAPVQGQPVMPKMLSKETDEQGRFLFTHLAAGRYRLSVDRAGFLRQNYGARKYSGGSAITLGGDQNIKDIVFKLTPQSVITGKVVDDDGDAVANVSVQAWRSLYRGGKKQWTQVSGAQTSDIGEFRLINLESGPYLVSANPNHRDGPMQTVSEEPLPEAPEMVFTATYYPSATDSAAAVPVEAGRGSEVHGINVRLRKARVFRIRGTVAGMAAPPGGRGGQTMVMLTSTQGGPQNMSMARPPDNRFELRDVTPGSYVLHTQAAGPNQGNFAYRVVEVSANHVDGIVLAPITGSDIAGMVKVEDAAAPLDLPNLNINLRPGFPMGNAPRAKAGPDLQFTLKNVLPMRYFINVSGTPETCFVKSIRYGGQEVPADGIDITGPTPIEITLSATAGQIDGVVTNADGKAAASVLVVLYGKDESAMRVNTTNENGGFSFRGQRPGDYRVMAFEDIPQGASQDPDFVKPFEGRAEAVKLEASGKATIQVKVIPAAETDK